jgi:hypothetical protein
VIVRAQLVAMQEKNSIIVELDNRRFLKELDPGFGTKTSADKHIPVAAHEVAGPTRGSKISQGIDHRLMMGIRVIIAYPDFKKISQDIQRIGIVGRCLEKPEKTLRDLRT